MAEWGFELDSLVCTMDSRAGFRHGTSGRSSQTWAGTPSGLVEVRTKGWIGDWGPETYLPKDKLQRHCRMRWGPGNGRVVLVSQDS